MTLRFGMEIVSISLLSLNAKDGMFHDACNISLPTADGAHKTLAFLSLA